MDSTMVEVTQVDRDAAKQLLDQLRIREHETGSFRSWDETVQAFARHRIQSEGRTGAGEALEERAVAIVKAHYPEMPASYRGRRFKVALTALTEAANEIASLRARVEAMREALEAISVSGIHRDTKWFGMNAHDIARQALNDTPG